MGMDSKNILAALRAGSISIEDAASRILKSGNRGASERHLGISGNDIQQKKIAGSYHKVIIEGPGNIDDLKVVLSHISALERHEIRIAVKAFSLNFADLLCVRGLYPSMPPYPFTPGLEVSGIVAGVGDGVKSFRPGDRVVAMAGKPLGGHATQLTCPEEQVFHKPESLSFEDACALPVVAVTMLFAFDKARVQWGEKVLIQTATGGTGLMAVQLAKYYGATIFATAGSDHKLAYLEKLGVPYRINYLEKDFEKEIDRLTGGRGVDVVINTLPGDAIQKGLNSLSPEGRYIELAMTGIKAARSIDISCLNSNQTFYSIDPGRLKRPEVVRNFFMEMLRMANQGILRATICKAFPFNEIKGAYRYLENRHNIGKIVVRIPDEFAYEEPPIPPARPVMKVRPAKQIDSCGVDSQSVAIIGMSGRFAGADDLNCFWDNLTKGKNSIREVPEWRWNQDEPVGMRNSRDVKNYLKWGGFLEDIDKFDPLFFNISPAEAEYMDPQQRLFLEESWKTLEDAGYAPEAISGRKCGVFVGVGKGDYLSGRSGSWEKANAHRLMGTAPSILAARISYILNLTGPSIAIDTACSSSLVAIHQACQSIVNSECEMALAGGICLLTTNELLIMAGQAGMLSPTGQCHTFDNGADGFVTGEGVGLLLLKSLPEAIKDGDSIRALIRGGGFNQDGRTNGITAPSARSQVKLEKEVYDRYGINPESISYVEAHGTGTKLGDPIEISALSEVFRRYTDKKQYCAIGSVKTNIGHTMSAAGAASVIKVALSLSHRKIPPSINFTSENEHINFSDTPFFVNTELRPWRAENGDPLRAAVSSFGFSGTNVHMVMEEYKEARVRPEAEPLPEAETRPVIFVLSARNGERLKEYARKMALFLDGWQNGDERSFNIADIAYTSQVGREAMVERLAVSVSSVEELVDKLQRFDAGDNSIEGFHRRVVEQKAETLSDSSDTLAADKVLKEAIQKWVEHGSGSELMSLWVSGLRVDWHTLYGSVKPRRISLPTYPFERERYWMTDDAVLNGGGGRFPRLQLHPLVHENRSDLIEQRYSATFTGDEFFLADHIINGKRVLPGVAYLEMARAAVMQAAALPREEQITISVKNVVWARPVIVGEKPVQVHIGLFPEAGGEISYEVYSYSGDTRSDDIGVGDIGSVDIGLDGSDIGTVVHCSGIISVRRIDEAVASPEMESDRESTLESIKTRCTNHKSHEALYGTGEKEAASSSFMCIRELLLNDDKTEALALLTLPAHLDNTFGSYALHPSLLNGAFETAIFGLHPEIANGETVLGLFRKGEAALPYSLGEIEIFHSLLPKECYAHAAPVGERAAKIFNIRLFDSSGKLLTHLHRFAARSMPRDTSIEPGIKAQMQILHPMIDRNISTSSSETLFIKRFTGHEFYLTDHVVSGRRVMPGSAYLEMAQAALSHAPFLDESEVSKDPKPGIVLKNILWSRPIISEEDPLDVYIRLSPEEREAQESRLNRVDYEIFTQQTGNKNRKNTEEYLVHSRGSAIFEQLKEPPALDIESIKSECKKGRVEGDDCYGIFAEAGFSYGPGHRGIETLYVGEGQVLARLALPASLFDRDGQFTLHPGLLDSALQASIGLMIRQESAAPGVNGSGKLKPSVPFALERMEIYGSSASTMWAHIRSYNRESSDKKIQKLDIDVCDDNGRLCARLLGYSAKEFRDLETETLLLKPSWREKTARKELAPQSYDHHIVVLCEEDGCLASTLIKAMKEVQCITLKSAKKSIQGRFETYAIQLFNEIKKLLQKKQTGKRLIQLVIPGNREEHLYMGLSGLLKSAEMENSTLFCQTIELSGERNFSDTIAQKLEEDARSPEEKVIRYQNERRLVAAFKSVTDVDENLTGPTGSSELSAERFSPPSIPWKDRGVYLITGGAGGLGFIFAREIASRVKDPLIILTGRSRPGPKQQRVLTELKDNGAWAQYQQADVRKREDVRKLIESIRKKHKNLNGIIHSAGIIRDNTIIKKTTDEFREVLGPKVAGVANLDEETRHLPLDFFIIFSSGAGALGNIGQADYACANAFMDAYAEYRERLVKEKSRSGRTLSINWPLWQEGGMGVDEETEKMLKINLGMTALETKSGIRAFYHTWLLELPRTLVAHGRVTQMRHKLLSLSLPAPEPVSATDSSCSPGESRAAGLLEAVKESLKGHVSKLMKIRVEQIDPRQDLGSYGFDSITLTGLTNRLNQQYGLELPPTLFFEYPTLDGFTKYLVETHASLLAARFAEKSGLETVLASQRLGGSNSNTPVHRRRGPRFATVSVVQEKERLRNRGNSGLAPVAIVGISGRFPMANNVEAFWKNLEAGRNSISEIPEERWDWRQCLKDGQKEESSGVRWGGFIDGVKDFDPMFFSISPREAELMDPQQRLMMIYVWKAMEDAAISPRTLSQKSTGVFISPGINEYMQLPSFPQDDPYAPMGIAISAIPNRISYMFNLHGPSEYCETACSSALVALHRGIVSISLGECEQAIIGAINLLLSPDGFSAVDAFGHLSPKGKAKSFQADADGYVRSEGVGAMIIKPLERAIRENDRIYAVIRGSGVAHGGRGISLTAPTGSGMKAAMEQAYRNSGVNPETISYIEAHGTATPMGDAIELNTLKSWYDEILRKESTDHFQTGGTEPPVYISSLKPCIGHGEIVSGMAALIKVVMALKHRTIPGVAGFETLNENISLKGSRFEISAENHPWRSLTDENGTVLPRRAAINSYGFGGVNAHAIVEEYLREGATPEERAHSTDSNEPVIFVLSARNQERLKEYAGNMAEFLEKNEAGLSDIAYTLQTGREAMEYRMAMVVTHKDEILKGLKAFAGKNGDPSELSVRFFTGNPKTEIETNPQTDPEIDQILPEGEGEAELKELLKERNLEKLAEYWVSGSDLPWEKLYQGELYKAPLPGKLSLPGYPFEKRRCWIKIPDEVKGGGSAGNAGSTKQRETLVGSGSDIRKWLIETLCAMLGLSESEVMPDHELGQLGFDSYIGVKLINRIQDAYGFKVPPERLLQYNTVKTLARYLTKEVNEREGRIDNTGTNQEKEPENYPGQAEESLKDAGTSENSTDAAGVNVSQDEEINLDELSESELDRLLEQHIADE